VKFLRRFLCWIGKHEMQTIAGKSGGVMYFGEVCSHCTFIDDDSIRSVLANRKRRRAVAHGRRKVRSA
jgi:hypothetical protein